MHVLYISTSACTLVCGDTRCPNAPALLSLQMGARASDQQWPLLLRSMPATTSQQTPSQLIAWPHFVMYVRTYIRSYATMRTFHCTYLPVPHPALPPPHTPSTTGPQRSHRQHLGYTTLLPPPLLPLPSPGQLAPAGMVHRSVQLSGCTHFRVAFPSLHRHPFWNRGIL